MLISGPRHYNALCHQLVHPYSGAAGGPPALPWMTASASLALGEAFEPVWAALGFRRAGKEAIPHPLQCLFLPVWSLVLHVENAQDYLF